MKVIYDAGTDILRILFSEAPIAESDEDKPGMIVDYAEDGSIVGMEILDASEHIQNPNRIDFETVNAKTV